MTKGLDEILSGAEPAQVEQAAVTVEQTPEPVQSTPEAEERPSSTAQPEATTQTPEERQTGMVPQKALHASRERARTAEERLADIERENAELRGQMTVLRQQPASTPQPAAETPKAIEIWDDPEKWGEQKVAPVLEALAQDRFERSVERNVVKYGEETCGAAETALKTAIESGQLNGSTVKAQLSQSRDPIGDIVRWHQSQPASVEARLRAEIEAKVRAELGGQQPKPETVEQPSTPPVMPSNLVGQRNVGSRSGPAWSGPATLNDIFDRSRKRA